MILMSEIQDNPFSAFINVIREDTFERAVAPWCFGIIRSLSPTTVEIGGQLVKSGVSINARLTEQPGIIGMGNKVVMLQSADGNEYVILCKVVG